jgi:hypothetical protein
MAQQVGNETRTSIFPSMSTSTFSTSYSPADSLLRPAQIGVRVGDNLGDVMNAVKGVAFYTDTIGFGESSTPFTKGMPLKPLGINYFIKTGQKCSNGADMYSYIEGIPKGDALGKNMQKAMKESGLPALRGLAPGIMEDAKYALDPTPLMDALFSSGYPQCKLVEQQVGDLYGRIYGDDSESWIPEPETAYRKSDNLYYQKKWVQDTDRNGNPIYIKKEEWEKTPKKFNADGSPKVIQRFTNMESTLEKPYIIIPIAILSILALGMLRK